MLMKGEVVTREGMEDRGCVWGREKVTWLEKLCLALGIAPVSRDANDGAVTVNMLESGAAMYVEFAYLIFFI